ncbi:MAG: hydrogenase maturation nickel metallochaperone HypA [Candidatus Caldatribacteriota bacterium]|jgi:hydrogenase nickel incorporation protein HypA/HybF|nr:hydrogenase maturation nickel metallochaperone HypA [Atribacterota bacterium]MDD3031302.1 hydrogenase maturation nickel metallochaperone HypA [Atribacterota bacterium]MDD3640408.1 hydrogenase maturation nickel metallochaperone HypA [Atribacterota bacterium]MDD4288200.1 hydrogenase maturation nickel metallochaperone HypA [Atribacterota bacterium]MDD4764423.1 hydrogenase maturation nickel metallochaperone HypA [Atribacterota bacterium]
MHERSVAKNLLRIVLDKSNITDKREKVKLIRIIIGEFTMIHKELLISAFYQLSKSTPAEKAKIEITNSPLKGKCQDCHKEFYLDKEEFKCPFCESQSINIISGDELFIQDIELEIK